jgi:hypothetical protein
MHSTPCSVQGWEKRDAGVLASAYSPDGRLLPPGAPAATGVSLDTLSFDEQGDLAVEEGHCTLRAGDQEADDGTYVVVVHRR